MVPSADLSLLNETSLVCIEQIRVICNPIDKSFVLYGTSKIVKQQSKHTRTHINELMTIVTTRRHIAIYNWS